MKKRGSGILLHLTSLPSQYGIGDMGSQACEFVDFLSEAGQSYWQILPLNMTNTAYGNSPYSSISAFAGNHLLISPERLITAGFISAEDLPPVGEFSDERVQFEKVSEYKEKLLQVVYQRNKDNLPHHQDYQRFCAENAWWLEDYSLFLSIKNCLGGIEWSEWPPELRDRTQESMAQYRDRLSEDITREKFSQYIFFTQWNSLKLYCSSKGIKIIGDIPIYVNYDSSDVWSHPEIFSLDEQKRPVNVAGVPPDYFSETGQLWGHPVYKWDVLKESGYSWWIQRVTHNLSMFSIIRLDHFRGFVGYWQVHASEKTAINGNWETAPAHDFFETLMKHIPENTIIAEDLGIITDDVWEIMGRFSFPGMKVLLFAFGDDLPRNPYAPHNHVKNCVIYTGTHDNNTVKGWYKNELSPEDRERISTYLGHKTNENTIHSDIMRLAMMSVANTAIIPMQDLLGLDQKYRMNLPASSKGYWEWRLKPGQASDSVKNSLLTMTTIYGREKLLK